ncbi:MAG: MFS transporter [Rhizobiaceae bacterium]
MFVLNGALFGIWASRIPAVAKTHQLTAGNLGILLLLMAAGAIIAFPVAGRAADTIGCSKVTTRVAVAYVASLVFIALSPTMLVLAVALFFFGAVHGSMDVAMNAWAGEVERASDKPVMSSFHAMFSLGAGLGAASGFFAATFGLSITTHFLFAGAVFAAITLPLAQINWASQTASRDAAPPLFTLPNGPLLAVGLVAFCASLGEGAMADWSAIFLVSTASVSEAKAALGYTVFSVAMVIMRLMGDRVVHRIGTVNSARIAGLAAAVGSAIAIVFGTFPMILLGFALMGVGYAVVMPLAFTRAANDPDIAPGQAIASVSTLGYGGILLGPPLIGFAAEVTSIRTAFIILTALALFIFVFAKVLTRK